MPDDSLWASVLFVVVGVSSPSALADDASLAGQLGKIDDPQIEKLATVTIFTLK